MKKTYTLPVSAFVKVRAYVTGTIEVVANSKEEAKRIIEEFQSNAEGLDEDSLPEAMSLDGEWEWGDDMGDFAKIVERESDKESIKIDVDVEDIDLDEY